MLRFGSMKSFKDVPHCKTDSQKKISNKALKTAKECAYTTTLQNDESKGSTFYMDV